MSPVANFCQLLQLLPTAHPLLLKHVGFHFSPSQRKEGMRLANKLPSTSNGKRNSYAQVHDHRHTHRTAHHTQREAHRPLGSRVAESLGAMPLAGRRSEGCL